MSFGAFIDVSASASSARRIVATPTADARAKSSALHRRNARAAHERAKAELKGLVPEDAQQAIGHGLRARRSKSGAISFDLLKPEDDHAAN
jgi:hypothetical protein